MNKFLALFALMILTLPADAAGPLLWGPGASKALQDINLDSNDITNVGTFSTAVAPYGVTINQNQIQAVGTNAGVQIYNSGTGVNVLRGSVHPGTDDLYYFGFNAIRWKGIRISTDIGDGTNLMSVGNLMTLRNLNSGVSDNDILRWDNGTSTWLPETIGLQEAYNGGAGIVAAAATPVTISSANTSSALELSNTNTGHSLKITTTGTGNEAMEIVASSTLQAIDINHFGDNDDVAAVTIDQSNAGAIGGGLLVNDAGGGQALTLQKLAGGTNTAVVVQNLESTNASPVFDITNLGAGAHVRLGGTANSTIETDGNANLILAPDGTGVVKLGKNLDANGFNIGQTGDAIDLTITTANNTTVDSTRAGRVILQAGDKTTGTGNGGDVELYGGAAPVGQSGGDVILEVGTSASGGTFDGKIFLFGNVELHGASGTSGDVTLKLPASFTDYSLTLPPDDGTPDQFLSTDGSGVTTWKTPGVIVQKKLESLAFDLTGSFTANELCRQVFTVGQFPDGAMVTETLFKVTTSVTGNTDNNIRTRGILYSDSSCSNQASGDIRNRDDNGDANELRILGAVTYSNSTVSGTNITSANGLYIRSSDIGAANSSITAGAIDIKIAYITP